MLLSFPLQNYKNIVILSSKKYKKTIGIVFYMFNNIFWTIPIVYVLKKQYLCLVFYPLAFTPYTLHLTPSTLHFTPFQ